ncbi:putative transport protein [Flavobacterium croceum DSM 17960]|uniref:Putative transport protein n=1 Tax=Flavobacterium croceum DSM 17960 TaxID=1121886 RepID=A0A2S4NAK9_9FLAO|nr:putative transporter [Flavobacterium croceum]POS02728.1 putative transport protein [Flavobacterium croceum DSM 17960]
MNWILDLFTKESIAQTLIIFGLVIALGIWLGKIKVFGISLGVTWVLFVGIFISYIGINVNHELQDFLKEFGLVLFVYTLGLQVGPGFFASLNKNALVTNLLAALIVLFGVIFTIILHYSTGNSIEIMSGIMSGAVTNTPGLGAAQTTITNLHLGDTSMVTLAYAVTYPFGVFGIIISILLLKKIFHVDIEKETEFQNKLNNLREDKVISKHLKLENKQLIGKPISTIFELIKKPIVISRMYHKGHIITPTPKEILAENDVLLIVAPKNTFEQLHILIGSESDLNLKTALDSNLVSNTIVVTNKDITHKRIGDIPEFHQHDFTFTRLHRAGTQIIPNGNISLQLGDNIKVVGTKEGLERITKVLGNSIKKLEVPDIAPIFIGIVLGIIVGSIPFKIPNIPLPVKIGLAGGPLIVALLLSRFGNKFYLNNYTTQSANLMIRELGITLFLASVGLSSGAKLSGAFAGGIGFYWIILGIIITTVPLITVGIIAKKYFKKNFFEICGLLAGASTDPPALAFALKIAGNDTPSASYATVYPLTMILRIVAAQLLILLFT